MLDLNIGFEFVSKREGLSTKDSASLFLLMFFLMMSLLESYFPERKMKAAWRFSYRINLSLLLFNSAVLSMLSVSTLMILAEKYSDGGLLSAISNPVGKALLAFLGLDLMLYLWHRATHHLDCLWMFHKVHHSDLNVNVSTAFRLHFLEVTITAALKALYIVLLGIDGTLVLVNETLLALYIMFHHSNISLPGERLIGRLFIVPSLHRLHHSDLRHEHDTNYGAVFSLWDRLFGTLAEHDPADVGLPQSPQDFLGLLKYGFRRNVVSSTLPGLPTANVHEMIAEAAYYKAKSRGFLPGHDLGDWLEAENEIAQKISALTCRPKNVGSVDEQWAFLRSARHTDRWSAA
ncbi:MAG: sterol desaturase family protein [Gammaproteobacteria bacterium]